MKIFTFVVNNPDYFISHRLAIGLSLLEQGHQVYVIGPGECPGGLREYGFKFNSVEMSRKGKNPFSELNTIWQLYRLFKTIKPDVVHLVTIKPYLYGGIAARLARVPAVVSAVAGLGILFSQKNIKAKILRTVLFPLYWFAFNHPNQKAIFQNTHDRDVLINWGVLSASNAVLIRGAGANLKDYAYVAEPAGTPVVSLAARLLKDKGVVEFVEASKILQQRNIPAEFWLIGDADPGNANTVSQNELDAWQAEGVVECLGYRTDIASLFAQSNIVSLPSYYGEGLPKVLIEAAACGRAVVTTDHPGCRDAITPNVTGLLVPVKDAVALADAIERLIKSAELRHSMGREGRKLAENVFAIEKIVQQHLDIYQDLSKD